MALKKYRKKIDKIDRKIAKLLVKRFRIARKIAREKKKLGMKIEDKIREKELISDRKEKFAKMGIMDGKFVSDFFNLIMKKSKDVQKKT